MHGDVGMEGTMGSRRTMGSTESPGPLRRARLIDLIFYASGGIGEGVVYVFLLRFAGSFFETYLGISPGQVGMLVLVPRLIDAFSDPFIGAWCDNHVSRYGKFKPYIQYGVYLMGASLVFIFVDWGQTPTMTLVLAYVFYIASQVIASIVKVPYLAALPVLTEDPKQRVLAVSLKFTFTSIVIIPVMAVIGNVIQKNTETGSHLNIYLYVAIVLALILFGAMSLAARSLRKSDTREYWDHQPARAREKRNFKQIARAIFRNKPLLLLMSATGTDFLAFGAGNNALVYYFRFNVGDTSLMGLYGLITGIVAIVSFLCVTPVANRFGRKNTYLAISFINTFICLSLLLIPYTNVAMIMVQAGAAVFFQGFSAVLLWSILGDCIDYDFWKNGDRSEGIATSAIEFINKFGSSFGAAIFYSIVLPAGYIAVTKEMPEPIQPASAKTAITVVLSVLPALAFACSFVAFLFFPISNKVVVQMKRDLYQRKLRP
jgi:GPH family glycoside/pentoside/hexuronide:cation symporter